MSQFFFLYLVIPKNCKKNMIPIRFVLIQRSLEYCFQDFVDGLHLSITLGVIQGLENWCLNFNKYENSFKIMSSKWEPWLDTSWRGTPNRAMTWLKNKCLVVSAVQLKVGRASTHLVKQLISTLIYLWPLTKRGFYSIQSMAHFQKGPMMTIGCSNARGRGEGFLSLGVKS